LINRARLQELQLALQENLPFYIKWAKLPRNYTHNFFYFHWSTYFPKP